MSWGWWVTVAVVALFGGGGLIWWRDRQAEKRGEQNERDRQIKESAKVAADQRDIAARPPRHRSDLLKRMRDGKL